MALINKQDAVNAINAADNYDDGLAFEVLSHACRDVALLPEVDAEPVTRCKDCKWCETFYHGPGMQFSYECTKLYLTRIEANDFCSKAERKDE